MAAKNCSRKHKIPNWVGRRKRGVDYGGVSSLGLKNFLLYQRGEVQKKLKKKKKKDKIRKEKTLYACCVYNTR